MVRLALRELVRGGRVVPDRSGPAVDDAGEPAAVVLSALSERERDLVSARAAHVRETLTGYRSGSAELAEVGEPRQPYSTGRPLGERFAAKAAELVVSS